MSSQKKSNDEKARLQAILLADSFINPPRFRPFTTETPKVLLPLANVPMLEYTLEFLASGGVEDIIIFAASHADQISAYIDSTRWKHRAPEITIQIVVSDACTSIGDALRHMDQLGIINEDFVLVPGDVVSNMDLKNALQVHRSRSEADPNIIMTMVFSEVSSAHAMRSVDDDLVVGINAVTGELLSYESDVSKSLSLLNPQIFESCNAVRLRADLLDTDIMICSNRLLVAFSDNFDYMDLHGDYISAVLRKDESDVLNDDKIFAHIATNSYASRVRDLRTYHTVSHDIMRRWTSPLVPDNNLLSETTFSYHKGNIYREQGVNVARGASIGSDCIIGTGASIQSGSTLSKAIIGRNVSIDKNSRVHGSYLWENVVVEAGVDIEGAIIGQSAVIKTGARICKGALIGPNVVIGPGHIVPPYACITALSAITASETEALAEAQAIQERNEEMQDEYDFDDATIDMAALSISDPEAVSYILSERFRPSIESILSSISFDPTFQCATRSVAASGLGYCEAESKISSLYTSSIEKPLTMASTSAPTTISKPIATSVVQQTNKLSRNTSMKTAAESEMPITMGSATPFSSAIRLTTTRSDAEDHEASPSLDDIPPLTLSPIGPSSAHYPCNVELTKDTIPFNPFLSPQELMKLSSEKAVGKGGKGRIFLRFEHQTYGAAGFLMNTISPFGPVSKLREHAPLASKDLAEYLGFENDVSTQEETEEPKAKAFKEVFETLHRGVDGKMVQEDIVIELVGLKFASDMNLDWFAAAMVVAYFRIAGFPYPTSGPGSIPCDEPAPKLTAKLLSSFLHLVATWNLTLAKFCRQDSDQIKHVLPGIMYGCLMHESYIQLFPHIIKTLFEADVLSLDAVTDFYEQRVMALQSRPGSVVENESEMIIPTAQQMQLLKALQPVVEWMNEDEDEDEDEDEEDEEEEEA